MMAGPERPTVYVETTVVSFLAARKSRNPIIAGQQAATRLWWESYRSNFRLVTSEVVAREVSRGDRAAALRRTRLLDEFDQPPFGRESVEALASALQRRGGFPRRAADDATHVAIAAVLGADYLCSWNFRHLLNPVIRSRAERICRELGFEPPIICTPLELIAVAGTDAGGDS